MGLGGNPGPEEGVCGGSGPVRGGDRWQRGKAGGTGEGVGGRSTRKWQGKKRKERRGREGEGGGGCVPVCL